MCHFFRGEKVVDCHTYPEGGENDPGDLLLDRFLEDVGERGHHVVAPQLLAQLRAKGQEPHAEDHLVLELEAALVAQHGRYAGERESERQRGMSNKNKC